jgi:glycosyltransferase involved in cell wall biosynthesis
VGAPRVLLVTDVAPGVAHVGGIWLRDLCAFLPAGRLGVVELEREPVAWPASLADVPHRSVALPPERGFYGLGRHVTRLTRHVVERYVRHVGVPRVADEVTRAGRELGADIVWMPLVGTTTLSIAPQVADSLGVPLMSMVWDPPEYLLPLSYSLRGRLLAHHMGRFGGAVRASTRCAVMSEAMKASYEERYGTSCIVMHHGIAESLWRGATAIPRAEGEFVIGYAGSLYAKDEWRALLRALDAVGWRVGGRAVVLRVFGASVEPAATSSHARIECRGWQSLRDTIDELTRVDIGYLPYWFDDRYRIAVEQSFPSKLSTYFAAGIPVLYHGPRRGSPTAFLERYPAGTTCHGTTTEEIITALERCAADPGLRKRSSEITRRAMEEELGEHVFRRRFADLLGVDADELRAGALAG